MRHNVDDRINQWIGPKEVTGTLGIDIDELTTSDVGRGVVYHAYKKWEYGKISSWRDGLIFVRFTTGDTAAACSPDDLELCVSEVSTN